MLTDLDDLQESDESITSVDLTFDVETTSTDGSDVVRKTYTFSYAEEWDKWMFTAFTERRASTDGRASDGYRNWQTARDISWNDVGATPEIDIPPEVTRRLKQATTADSVILQEP